ncbi:unnamed protein product [Spirodela intermedia]|uniref:Uncharacterized protein n=1 Tax=Spirodela intermedia TaxID=51605 RepID=A0A7I8K232_SPIIN|nr:unnamed protein product [Spirodela intermedia]
MLLVLAYSRQTDGRVDRRRDRERRRETSTGWWYS